MDFEIYVGFLSITEIIPRDAPDQLSGRITDFSTNRYPAG